MKQGESFSGLHRQRASFHQLAKLRLSLEITATSFVFLNLQKSNSPLPNGGQGGGIVSFFAKLQENYLMRL